MWGNLGTQKLDMCKKVNKSYKIIKNVYFNIDKHNFLSFI